jgi:hypothetical protein
VPNDVVRMAAVEHLPLYSGFIEYDEGADVGELVALCGGVLQFAPGPALDSLLARWVSLVKEIRGVPSFHPKRPMVACDVLSRRRKAASSG